MGFCTCTLTLQEAEAVFCIATNLLSFASISQFVTVYTSSNLLPVATCSPLLTGVEPKSGSCTYALS